MESTDYARSQYISNISWRSVIRSLASLYVMGFEDRKKAWKLKHFMLVAGFTFHLSPLSFPISASCFELFRSCLVMSTTKNEKKNIRNSGGLHYVTVK